MKNLLIMALLMCSLHSFAQKDSVKVEQFCQIIAVPRLLSNKVTINIDFGEEKKFWSDTRLKTWTDKVRTFNTIIDAMNYMGKAGWSFINAYPVRTNDTEIFHFAFKKLVYLSDLH
jgi:hypothetical protein